MRIQRGAMLALLWVLAAVITVTNADCTSDPCSVFATCTNDAMAPLGRTCACDAGSSAGNGEVCVDNITLTLNSSDTSFGSGVHRVIDVEAVFTVPEFESKVTIDFTIPQGGGMDAFVLSKAVSTTSSSEVTNDTLVITSPNEGSTVTSITLVGPALNADRSAVETSGTKATITASYQVLVLAQADAGTVTFSAMATYEQNSAQVTTSSASVDFTVAEPQLEHTLSATSTATELDAGDEVTLELTLQHTSGASDAAAYDVSATVAYDAGLEVNGATVTCDDAGSATLCESRYSVSVDNGAGTLTVTLTRLDEAEVLTVGFTATLAPDASVHPSQSYGLSLSTVYDSSPRDGAQYPGRTYTVSAPATAAITTRMGTLSALSLDSTGYADTTPETTVSAGETAVLSAVIGLPEGSSQVNVSITWAGGELEYESSRVSAVSGSITADAGAPDDGSVTGAAGTKIVSAGAGSDAGVLFDFGQLTMPGSGAGALDDFVTVEVTVSVPVDAADGSTIVLSVGGFVGADALSNTGVTLTVARPVLEVTRTIVSNPGSVVDAGDSYVRRVTIAHATGSKAPAFEVSLREVVDSELSISTGTVSCSGGAGCSSTLGNGNTLEAVVARLDVGGSVVVEYTAAVIAEVEPGDTINESGGATVDYTVGHEVSAVTPAISTVTAVGDNSELATVPDPTVALSLQRTSVSLSQGTEVVAQEFVGVKAAVSVAEVTTAAVLTFTITTPAEVAVQDVVAVVNSTGSAVPTQSGPSSTAGDTTTLDLGTVTNAAGNGAQELVIELQFYVVSAVGDGVDIRGSSVGVACGLAFSGGSTNAPSDVTLVVAEPQLEHTLSATSTATELDAGDEVTLELTLQHTSGASDAAAYDVSATVAYDAGLEVNGATVTCDDAGSATLCESRYSVSVDNGAGTLTVTLTRLDEAEVLTVGFTATLAPDASVHPSQSYGLSLSTVYDSSPRDGAQYPGRTYTVSAPATAAITTRMGTLSALSLDSTGYADTTPETTVSAGETAVLSAVIGLPEGSSQVNVSITWAGGELEYESSRVSAVSGSITADAGAPDDGSVTGAAGTKIVSAGAGSDAGALFDFGQLTMPGSGAGALDDFVTVEVTVSVPVDAADGSTIVLSVGGFVGADALSNTGVTLTVARPVLEVTRTIVSNPGSVVDAGDSYVRRVTIAHATGSKAPAFEVSLREVVDSELSISTGTVSCSGGAGCSSTLGNGNTLEAVVARLDVGGSVVVEYTAAVIAEVEPGDTINESGGATVNYTVGHEVSAVTPAISTVTAVGDNSELATVPDPTVALSLQRTSVSLSQGTEVVAQEFVGVKAAVSVAEVTTAAVLTFTITTPAEVAVQDVVAVVNSTGSAVPTQSGPSSTAGDTTTLDLGTVTNAAGNGAQELVIELQFYVVSAVGDGVDIRGSSVGVACGLAFSGGSTNAPSDVTLVVAEPQLEHTLSATSTATELDAGDEVTLELTLQHTSGASDAAAYDVSATVAYDAGLEVNGATVTCDDAGSATLCESRYSVSVDNGAGTLTVTLTRLDEAEVLTVGFTATLAPDASVHPSQSYDFTTHTDYDSSPVGLTLLTSTTAAITTRMGTLSALSLDSTGYADTTPETAPDEAVTYRFAFVLPSGQSQVDLLVEWDEPGFIGDANAVSFVGSAVSMTGVSENDSGTGVGSNAYLFDFGTVTVTANTPASARRVEVDVTVAVPADVVSVTEFDVYGLSATLTTDGYTFSDATNVTVVETNMTVSRSVVVAPSVVDAADEYTFRSVVSHLGDSLAPGYDVEVRQEIDALLTFTTFDCVPAVCSVQSQSGNVMTLGVAEIGLGTQVEMTWRAIVNQEIRPNDEIFDSGMTELTFRTSSQYTSAREYDTVTLVHNSTQQLSTVFQPSLSVAFNRTSFDETPSLNVAIHEEVGVRLLLDLPEVTTDASFMLIYDFAPSDATLLDPSVSVESAGNIVQPNDSPVTLTSVQDQTTLVSFASTTLVNKADNSLVPTASNVLEVDFVFRVPDVPALTSSSTLTVTANVTYDGGVASASETLTFTIVTPNISPSLAISNSVVDSGDVRVYTLTLVNQGTGPAYDVNATGTHPAGIVPTPGSVGCDICDGSNPLTAIVAGYEVSAYVPVLRNGQTVELTWSVEFTSDTDVRRNDAYAVQADADYDTSPETTGSYVGRPLSITQQEVTVNIAASTVSLTFVSDSMTESAPSDGSNLAVDESAVYEVVVTLHEGSSDLKLECMVASVAYTGLSANVTSIDGDLIVGEPTLATNGSSVPLTATYIAGYDAFVFEFGEVTHPGTTAYATAQIVVRFSLYVDSERSAKAGDRPTIYARLYDDDTRVSAPSVAPLIREPLLTSTDVLSSSYTGDACDELVYEYRLSPSTSSSRSDAFDVVVTFQFDVRQSQHNDSFFSCISTSGDAQSPVTSTSCAAISTEPTTHEYHDGYVIVRAAHLRQTDVLYIAAKATLLQVVEPQEVLENVVSVSYDSSPLSSPYDGRGYTVDDLTIRTTIDDGSTAISVMTTSDATTSGRDLTIEEEALLQVRFTFPEVTAHAVLEIDIPANMEFLNATFAHLGSNIQDSAVQESDAFDGVNWLFDEVNQQVVADLGTITVVCSDSSTADDQIDIQVAVRLRDDSMNDGLNRATTFDVDARISFPDTKDGAKTSPRSLRFTVVEPELENTISTSVNTTTTNDAGDNIDFFINVKHTDASTAIAYRTVTHVFIVPQYTLDASSIQLSYGGSLAAPSVNQVSASYFQVVLESLELGEELDVVFTVRVNQNVRPEQVVTSEVETNYTTTGSSFPQPGRIHADGAEYAPANNTVDVTMDRVYITTQLVATSLPETPDPYTNIHETSEYEIVVTLPEVTTDLTVRFSLAFAPSYTYRNASVRMIGGSVADSLLATGDIVASKSPVEVDFSFGEIRNLYDNVANASDQLVLRVTAQLDNSLQFNKGGQTRTVKAYVDSDAITYEAESFVVIAEPDIELWVDVDKLYPLDAGDVVTYTVNMPWISSPPAYVSSSCIYDMTTTLVVDDTLSIISADLGTVTSSVNISADAKTVSWDTAVYLPTESLVFTFQAVILNKVVPDERNLITDADYVFDSHRGSMYGQSGRVYTDTAMAPELTIDEPVIVYTTVNSSLPLTAFDKDLAIHESVLVWANATLPEATTRAVLTLQPALPDFDAWVVLDSWFEVGASLNCTTTPELTDTDAFAFTSNDTATFDFGVCVNAYDNVEDDADRLFVYAVFAPIDHRPTVVNQRNISLAAHLDYSDQALYSLNRTSATQLQYRVVEPNLTTLIEFAAAEPVDAGDVVSYTITVAHNGESTAAAYDLVVVAEVHPNMDIVSADGGLHGAQPNISADAKVVTYTLATLPLADPVLVVTFEAVVLNSMVPTEINVVALQNVTYDSHLETSSYGLPGREDTRAYVCDAVEVADLAIRSDLLLSSDDNTELFDIAVSETYTSAVTVTLPELTMNVTIATDFVVDNATWLVDFEYQVGERVVCTIPRPAPQFVDDNGDGVHDGLVLDFGTCENQRDNVADIHDKIVVTTVASLRDTAVAQAGQPLVQSAAVTYTKDLVTLTGTLASNNLTYTVVEPVVELTMDVLSLDPTDAGDKVKYGLTLTHTEASTASCYDLTFTAHAHPMLRIVAADGGPLGAAANISADGTSVVFALSEFALSTRTTYVAFDAVVQNDVVPNAAGLFSECSVTFDTFLLSIFGQAGRTMSLNTTSPEVNVAVPNMALMLYNTSDALTTPDSHVTIDELYIYRSRVYVPEVTTELVLDMVFNSTDIVVQRMWSDVGANVHCAGGPDSGGVPRLLSNGTQVMLDLGTCENRFDNAVTMADYVDLYAEVHVPDMPALVDGVVLMGTSSLNFTDSTNTSASVMLTDERAVTVVEPTMRINLTDPAAAFVRRSQLVPLRVSMTPSFGHDVVVTVTLPEYLHYESTAHTSGASRPASTVDTVLGSGSTTIVYDYGSVPEEMVIEFDVMVRVDAQAPGAHPLDVTVDLSYDSSPRPGLGRPYSDSAAFRTLYVVLLDMATSYATNDATTAGGDLAIEEEVTFMTAIGIKGPSALVVTFDLPTDGSGRPLVALVSSAVDSVGGNIVATEGQVLAQVTANTTSATQVMVDFGHVENLVESSSLAAGDMLSFNVTFIVLDEAYVVSQMQGSLAQEAAFAGLSVQLSTPVRIVEPLLASATSISPQGGDAGDVLTLTHRIWHTAASTHTGYELSLVVSVDEEGLELQAMDDYITLTSNTTLGSASDVSADGSVLYVMLPSLPLGVNATLELRMRLKYNVTLATTYGALVPLVYTSRAVAPRRTAELFTSASMQTDGMADPALALTGSTASFGSGEGGVPVLTTGERFSMSLVLPLREGLMTDLVSQLSFPLVDGQPVMSVVEANITRAGEQLAISGLEIVPLTSSDVDGASAFRRRRASGGASNSTGGGDAGPVASSTFNVDDEYVGAEFRFGRVLNMPDNTFNASDKIEVMLVGEVLDVTALGTNVPVTLSTALASDGSSGGAEVTVNIARPELNVTLPGATLNVKRLVQADGVVFTYVTVPVTVYHTNASALLAEDVRTTLAYSGSAVFEHWTDAPAPLNATQPYNVSSFAVDADAITVTQVLLVDEALNTRDSLLCLDATVAYTTPQARVGGRVAHLEAAGAQCSKLAFPAPSKSFIETLQGQLIIYIAAAVAFIAIVVASVILVKKNRRAAEERKKKAEADDTFDYGAPVPHPRGMGGGGRRSGSGQPRTYVDPETGEVHHAYDYVGRKDGGAIYGKAGSEATYDDVKLAPQDDEEDYGLVRSEDDDEETYDQAGRAQYEMGDGQDEDDYALAAKYDNPDGDDEDDYALAAKYDNRTGGDDDDYALAAKYDNRTGGDDDEDDYALAAKYDNRTGGDDDDDDYALAAKYDNRSGGDDDEGDYAFANKVGARGSKGAARKRGKKAARHSDSDYARAMHDRRGGGGSGSDTDDIYGLAEGEDDTYGLAGAFVSSGSNADESDDTYGLADAGGDGGSKRKKPRKKKPRKGKKASMDIDETYGLAGDFSGSEADDDDDGDGEGDYSFAGKVRGKKPKRAPRKQQDESEDDYGLAGDVLSQDNATDGDADDDDDDVYKQAGDVNSSSLQDSGARGGKKDDDDDEPVYSRVHK
ncbi:hypothetical protein PTSG_13117 [Salpingoeca rosetta]|uniref:EGF-like domain-containing protein n=1 Tax=Salpingoeca rosetta (strain ATCC 50818 / BSB-021) TaxID=946362 RepID=F2URC8_SALR5|nr:uncharacterized protein PTSG_13117 [Salpingoeca rosetta]EGD80231.1 hypothetical protein PTSG_13117 [Salpingoeca rosetta]|eukprot:XP_004988293.1 hypothetical protein PTSG_13117 [Salpingoeca rosetta]